MSDDEQAVRQVIATWLEASNRGDHATVLGLIADDAEFLVCGQDPFGKAQFAASSKQLAGVQMTAHSEVRDVQVAGDWAWVRTELAVEMTPPGGEPRRRAGATLSILRREPDGRWVFVRDANFLR